MASSVPILRPPRAQQNGHSSRYSAMTTEEYRRSRAEELRNDLPLCHPWLRRSWLLFGISSGILLLGLVLLISGAMIAGTTMQTSGMGVIYAGITFTIIAIMGFSVFGWLFNAARSRLRKYLQQNRWLAQRRSQPIEFDDRELQTESTSPSVPYATRDRGRPSMDSPRIKSTGQFDERPPLYIENSVKLPLPTSNNIPYETQNGVPKDFHQFTFVSRPQKLPIVNRSNYSFVNNAFSGSLTRPIQSLEPRELLRSTMV